VLLALQAAHAQAIYDTCFLHGCDLKELALGCNVNRKNRKFWIEKVTYSQAITIIHCTLMFTDSMLNSDCSIVPKPTEQGTDLKKDSRGLAVKQAKVALGDSALSRAQRVLCQHAQHACEEDLPAQRLTEKGRQLLIGKQQAPNGGPKGCCNPDCCAYSSSRLSRSRCWSACSVCRVIVGNIRFCEQRLPRLL